MNGFDIALMTQHYLVAALWSSTGDEGDCENLDDKYGIGDLHPDTRRQAEQDCRDFCETNRELVLQAIAIPGYDWERLGHDLWLTRNGHGVGFWDRKELDVCAGDDPDCPDKTLGDLLTDACKRKELDLYVGDDKRLYFGSNSRPFLKKAQHAA